MTNTYKILLHKACRDGDLKTVKILIDLGVNVNASCQSGFIDLGISNKNISSDYMGTPLKIATEKKHEDIVRLLKKHGAKDE